MKIALLPTMRKSKRAFGTAIRICYVCGMTPVRTILAATGNQKKAVELRELLADLPIRLLTGKDFPDMPVVVEDAQTFEGNALKKARAGHRYVRLWTLADDSGLEVDALGGRPGVHSARYAGEPSDDRRNWEKLLSELGDVPDAQRTARFRCVLALVGRDEGGQTFEKAFAGTCEGRIAREPRGSNGFGYDPVFWIPAYDCTMAELGAEVKNQISHRADAMRQLRAWLERTL